jgi:hypothetical protein
MGAEGWIVVFSDGTNWIAYQLGKPALAITIDAWNYSSIALGAATAYASSGTMDWASVTKSIGIFWHRNGSTTTSRTMDIKNAMIFGAAKLIGGGLGNAVKPKYLPLALDAAVIRDISRRQGGSQVLVKGGLQIGDGSTPTYFDLSASSVEYPLAYSASDYSLSNWNANASSSGVTIYASANDANYCSAGVLATTIAQPFTIHASSSLSATYSFLGASFVGWDVTDNAGLAWNGATFSGGGIATIAGGGDLTNCSISKTTSTNAALAITANGSVLTSTTITVADTSVATDYHLELGTAVTAISLVDVTFSGTAASAGNNKVHVLKTTGTVTITISGTTSLASGDVTSAGATVVIAAPELYQSVPITGLSTTCRVQLYDTSAATELYNGEPGATTYTWTDASPAVSARPIRLRITDYLGSTAKSMIEANIGTCGVTEGTETVSYNAELAQDTSYNAMASALGYTGADVTDIQIEDATDTVKFNYLAGGDYDARRIYMYMVYWLDTEAGIRDDFVFCDPPDSANLPMQAVQFKNVTSPSETITFVNAYVYDAATGRAADLIDTTGGNICFAPDHVVVTTVSTSDAVISGTAAEIIAAIPSAADNADAVLDDGRALTVGKFVALKSL